MPFNQLGTLAGTGCYGLNAAYYYIRWFDSVLLFSDISLCAAKCAKLYSERQSACLVDCVGILSVCVYLS